jgi:SAM-dependent methyltransferase
MQTSAEFWEDEFSTDQPEEDWIASAADLLTAIGDKLKPTDRILVIGCGRSQLSAALHDAGFQQITSTDLSTVAVDTMRRENQEIRPLIRWLVADCTKVRPR